MSNVITYDIWIFIFVCLWTDNFLPQLVCLHRTILPALLTIIAYHLKAHIMLLRFVICNYIWHMTKSVLWAMWKKEFSRFYRKLLTTKKRKFRSCCSFNWPTRPRPNRWSLFSHVVSVRLRTSVCLSARKTKTSYKSNVK